MPPDPTSGSTHPAAGDPEPRPQPDSTGGLEALKRLLGRTGVFERYKLEGEIARGGMGAILRVWDADLQRHLAMKVVLGQGEAAPSGKTPPVDARRLARFLDEAQVTSQLDHPGIVPVHELGLDAKGCVYFTMKLVKGKTLKEVFDELAAGEGGLRAYTTTGEQVLWTQARVLGLIQKVCEAMSYAHHKGVIHRDLKPANVMVGRFGEVYVMDWGLARVLDKPDQKNLRIQPAPALTSEVRSERREVAAETPDSPLVTMDGDVVGTPSYMSPEQAAGRVSEMGPPSDVYAVGAMLYQMLAGQMPYVPYGARLNNYAIWRSVQAGPPDPVHELAPDAPSELVAICEKAMARDPKDRYRDMAELSKDLAAYMEGRVVRAFETGTLAELRKWIQRNKMIAATTASAAVALVVGLVASLSLKAQSDRNAVLALQGQALARSETARAQANAEQAQREQQRAEANSALAEERRVLAEKREREARWQVYVSSIRAAEAAYRLNNEPANMRRALDAAPEEFRNWEWGYLNALQDSSLMVLRGKSDVASFCFSPDGQHILVGYHDGTASLFDAKTTVQLAMFEHPDSGEIRDRWLKTSFTADGSKILTAGDHTARIWDVASGAQLLMIQAPLISEALLSPDGRRLVIVPRSNRQSEELANTPRLWDASSGKELCALKGHEHAVCSASFSPDSSRIVTGSEDGTVRVWDAEKGVEIAVLPEQEGKVTAVAFSPDGSRIASDYSMGAARLWDASSAAELAVLRGHRLRFSSDGSCLLTQDTDRNRHKRTVDMWDVATGFNVGSWDMASGVNVSVHFSRENAFTDVALAPDGSRVATASADKTVRLWDTSSGVELAALRGHESGITHVSFSPDGTLIAAAAGEMVRLWSVDTRAEVPIVKAVGAVLKAVGAVEVPAAISPEGSLVVTGTFISGDLRGSKDNDAHLWDATTGVEVATLRGHKSGITSVAFSPDSSRVVTVSRYDDVRSWDAATGLELAILTPELEDWGRQMEAQFSPDGSRVVTHLSWGDAAHVRDAASGAESVVLRGTAKDVESVCFSPDGSRIVTSCRDKTARLFDASTGTELTVFRGHAERIGSVAFSPDGSRILTGSWDRTARLWDAASGDPLAVLRQDDRVNSVSFSPDGTRLLTTSGNAGYVWDGASGVELALLRGHEGPIDSAAFSPDGSRIVTASQDGAARVWDPVSGEQLAVLQGAFTAEFSPDGSRILTGSYDGEAHVYDGVPWQARFRERATLEPEALRILQTLEPACPSLTEAVHRIRDDGDLDAPMRHAVMDLVRRRVSEATAWIRDLRERMGLREDILAAVNADTVRHPWVRELAQRYAATLEDDPSDLNNAAWRTAGSPGHSVEEYRSALRAAQAAVAALPDNWYYVNTLGVAQYRCALFAEALTTLARSVELAGEVRPPDLVFLAMARFRLGQVDAARADLARLRELLQGSEDKQQRTLLSEAEALIGE